MKLISSLLAAVITCLFSMTSIAQNYVMDNGQTSVHGSAYLGTGNFENVLAIQSGFTWDGRLTLGVDLGKSRDNVNRITTNIVRPHIGYMIIKQREEGLPLSVNIEAAYQYNILPSTPANSQAIQGGGGLYKELPVTESVSIIPHANLFAIRLRSKNGFNVENQDLATLFNAGITVKWQKVYVEPRFIINDEIRSYAFKVGVVW